MKIIILGGGPSGLGVAWELTERGFTDITVIEKEERLGGLSASLSISGATVDIGPHRLSPEIPEVIERVRQLLKEDLIEADNLHAVHFHQRNYLYPPHLKDFINFGTLRFSVPALLSFVWGNLWSYLRPPASFSDHLRSRFGSYLYERMLEPMVQKVWGNPDEMDPEFASLRFSLPSPSQWVGKLLNQKKGFNDKVFYYPRKGFQQIWDALQARLESRGVTFLLKTRLTDVHLENQKVKSVRVTHRDEPVQFDCDYLVSTIPAPALNRVLKPNPFLPQELLLHSLKKKGMLLATFFIKKEKVLPARVVIFPEKRFLFNRLTEQNQFSVDTVPAGLAAVTADVLVDPQDPLWLENEANLLDRIESQLLDCHYFSASDVVERTLHRFENAYPLPFKDREHAQKILNEKWGAIENLYCSGRFASSDYNNSHTALKKGFMAAEAIDQGIPPNVFYRTTEDIRKKPIRD